MLNEINSPLNLVLCLNFQSRNRIRDEGGGRRVQFPGTKFPEKCKHFAAEVRHKISTTHNLFLSSLATVAY
jgi:hypothetical protein